MEDGPTVSATRTEENVVLVIGSLINSVTICQRNAHRGHRLYWRHLHSALPSLYEVSRRRCVCRVTFIEQASQSVCLIVLPNTELFLSARLGTSR
jgi:hypothetical protein